MNWQEIITDQELYRECPELSKVSYQNLADLDLLVEQVRDIKAVTYFHKGPSMIRKLPDDEFRTLSDKARLGRDYKGVDYRRAEVVKFDESKKNYWHHVKEEIRLLICTKNKKYNDVRTKLKAVGNRGNQAIVAIIASAIGQSLGVTAGAVSGLVAIAMFAVVKIGVNAYCSMSKTS